MKSPNQFRVRGNLGPWSSDDSFGPNGMFSVPSPVSPVADTVLKVIASNGDGWDHVSVSLPHRCPDWPEMCHIKDLFWSPEETVIQYHPAAADYVNHHPHCLHMWRKQEFEFPVPPTWMVGPGKGE